MTDAIISIAVQKIGDFLGDFAVQKISEFIGGFDTWERIRKDVEWVQEELKYMQPLIEYAEGSPSIDNGVRSWIIGMGDIASDMRDLLETYALEKKQELEKKIKSIKEELGELNRRRKSYGIKNLGAGEQGSSSTASNNELTRQLRRTSSYRHEDHLVIDLTDEFEILLDVLHKPKLQRVIIAIHGMGGLGKTTIAQKLYNSVLVRNKFDCQAWVCVSQDYNIENLLRIVIKSLCNLSVKDFKMIERMTEADMERHLRNFLENRKYLLVLDDVWDKEVWKILKRAFPESENSSRVIITTRNENVAKSRDDTAFLHHLRFLTEIESWKLFCAIAFQGSGEACLDFSAKEKLGKEMVGKCRGLPLAVIVLGGLLLHKESLQEWLKVKEQLWRQLRNGSIEISLLLFLSYNDLPRHLKLCFLYVGMFPEDYKFEARKLMKFWMAEEFIQGEIRMEDLAEEYLNELISRNLIQITDQTFANDVVRCKVHDLLRELAIEKAKEIKLFYIYDPRKYSKKIFSDSRRLAVHSHIHNFLESNHTNSKLQSLVFFNPDGEYLEDKHIDSITENFKSLRLLDLGACVYRGCRLSCKIGKLIYLKLLWLPLGNVLQARDNLKCLKFLDLGSCDLSIIPREVDKLKGLRHLFGRALGDNLQLESFTNLQTLGVVKSNAWCKIDTTNLVNLRRLHMALVEPEHVIQSLQSITKLKSLEELRLTKYANDGTIEIPIQSLSSCQSLLRLETYGEIKNQKLPPMNEFPPLLEMLRLNHSVLMEDPFPVLKELPNLKYLELSHLDTEKKMICTAGGFQQLKILSLSNLTQLEEWQVEKGAMPVLKTVNIYGCWNLKMVPEELKCVNVTTNDSMSLNDSKW